MKNYIKLYEVFSENKIDIKKEIEIINNLIYHFSCHIYKNKKRGV